MLTFSFAPDNKEPLPDVTEVIGKVIESAFPNSTIPDSLKSSAFNTVDKALSKVKGEVNSAYFQGLSDLELLYSNTKNTHEPRLSAESLDALREIIAQAAYREAGPLKISLDTADSDFYPKTPLEIRRLIDKIKLKHD